MAAFLSMGLSPLVAGLAAAGVMAAAVGSATPLGAQLYDAATQGLAELFDAVGEAIGDSPIGDWLDDLGDLFDFPNPLTPDNENGGSWDGPTSPNTGQPASPLVLDLDGDGIELTTLAESRTYFDLDNDGFAERTGWVASDDALLAMDRNGNGRIDDKAELFGDDATAADGFQALARLDDNGDGVIDANDVAFAELRLWRDLDQDGVSDVGELETLQAHGILSLPVNAQSITATLAGHPVSLERFTGEPLQTPDGSGDPLANLGAYVEEIWQDFVLASALRLFLQSVPGAFVSGLSVDTGGGLRGQIDITATARSYLQNFANDLLAAGEPSVDRAYVITAVRVIPLVEGIALAVGHSPDDVDIALAGAFEDAGIRVPLEALRSFELNPSTIGNGQNEIVLGTAEVDALTGAAGDDWLLGFGGDDALAGGDGDDALVGYAGDDDVAGGKGDDRYAYALGDGHDRIVETYSFFDHEDRVVFADLNLEDVYTVSEDVDGDGIGDLKIAFHDAEGSVTITKFGRDSWMADDHHVGEFAFADGTVLDLDAFTAATWGTIGDDVFDGSGEDDWYRAAANEGDDRIVESYNSTRDRLVFDDLSLLDVYSLLRDVDGDGALDLEIGFNSAEGSIAVLKAMADGSIGANARIEDFEFADGTTLTWNDFLDQTLVA